MTPEETAAAAVAAAAEVATKAAEDKGTADAAAAALAAKPPAPVVPETYTLVPPTGVTVDPALLTRTATQARALGLTQENGQKLFDSILTEATARETAFVESWTPGTGTAWKAQDVAKRAEALADPEIGGSPEKLATSIELANRALAFVKAPPEFKKFLADTGLGSDVRVLRVLARFGKATSESSLVLSGTHEPGVTLTHAERLYGKDGTGLKK